LHSSLSGTDLQLFKARFPRRLAFSPGLYRAMRRMAPSYDVMHIHNLWQFPQYAAYKAALAARIPYVVSPHGALDPYLRQHGRLRKRLMSDGWQNEMLNSAKLIHVTTAAEERLISDIAPDVPRAVVPCGLYVDEFSALPSHDVFRRQRLDGYDGPVILFLGRITQKKGVDVLIRAFAHARGVQECRLVVVGPDDERLLPSLRRLVRDLGMTDDVCFLDPVYGDDRLAALATADVWALASHTENFGIAVAEAMAAGCAVVISPEVNLADDVAAGEAGVVADLDPRAFGEALLNLLADDHRRAHLRRTAPLFARRYDWSVVAPELLRMYERAVGPNRAGRLG
jgi:glycosyltransferase involved in cell wall biosynthesis